MIHAATASEPGAQPGCSAPITRMAGDGGELELDLGTGVGDEGGLVDHI